MSIREASEWASGYLQKNVTPSNISYLINYGRIRKFRANGDTRVAQEDLIEYYQSFLGNRETNWRERLGEDLNWALSFEQFKEKETTKHVHRLHPYKGKFIPQLVEYFLDNHTDNFKREVYFHPGDVVLDPFCGSGTTLVQANELGIHAIGIDISAFNAFISNAKISQYNLVQVQSEAFRITRKLQTFIGETNIAEFERALTAELQKFNAEFFPSPEYKFKVRHKQIDGKRYGAEKAQAFLPTFERLVEKYNIKITQADQQTFLGKWYLATTRREIAFLRSLITEITDPTTQTLLSIILSRTARSCRATTHADLGTLKDPVYTTYYCHKHGKICKPLFSTLQWWKRYSDDTIKRVQEFSHLRTDTQQSCLVGDARAIPILDALTRENPALAQIVANQKIKGIFSSPPYVGLINYHEQHAYAYELFGFSRNDDGEIGPLFRGQGKEAQQSYVQGISEVLRHAKQFLADDYDVFLVANDKFNLYPAIAQRAGMQIVNRFKRPVLNRTEKDKNAYAEIIFHLKEVRAKLKKYSPETKAMPFHYRLLGKDRMALYSFIQSLNTTFGVSIFEPVAITLAKNRFAVVTKQIQNPGTQAGRGNRPLYARRLKTLPRLRHRILCPRRRQTRRGQ